MRAITTTAPNTGLNRNVLNVLCVLRNRANFIEFRLRERGQFVSLSRERIVDNDLRVVQLSQPGSYLTPVCKSLDWYRCRISRRVISYCQSWNQITKSRTHRFVGNWRKVRKFPRIRCPVDFGLDLWMVEGYAFRTPALREREVVARVDDG